MTKRKKSLSQRDWYDSYYDSEIGIGEGFDEDTQEVVRVMDYWGFNITQEDKGYIEDESFEDLYFMNLNEVSR